MLNLHIDKTLAGTLRMDIKIAHLSIKEREWENGATYKFPSLGAECITPEEVKHLCESLKRDLDKIARDAQRRFDAHMKNMYAEKSLDRNP